MLAWLTAYLVASAPAPLSDTHAENTVLQGLTASRPGEGGAWSLGGVPVGLAPPGFLAERDPARQRALLEAVAGTKGRADDLLRDSITAPFVLKVRDLPGRDGSVVRAVDLWFVVHADLDSVDPDAFTPGEGGAVEAGNMRFEARRLGEEALRSRGLTPAARVPGRFPREEFVTTTADLLDRLRVETTSRVLITRRADSLVVAMKTDPAFATEGPGRNAWRPSKADADSTQAYEGGGGYVAVSRYGAVPGALIVEAHFAFLEPRAWFDGNPILRSKIGLVAQDQIRAIRRELKKAAGR